MTGVVRGSPTTTVTEIATARLRLRRWRASDAEKMSAINSDPEVTQYLNTQIDASTLDCFVDNAADHWRTHGFGLFALEVLDGAAAGDLIGFAGVSYPSSIPDMARCPELAWRLSRAWWGLGLATEAAAAAWQYAREVLGVPSVVSIIHPENARSQSVARKLGMYRAGETLSPVLGLMVDVWRPSSP